VEVTVFDELVQADTAVFRQPDIDARTRTLERGHHSGTTRFGAHASRRCEHIQLGPFLSAQFNSAASRRAASADAPAAINRSLTFDLAMTSVVGTALTNDLHCM
jgi:hypothetical protein